MVSAGGQGFVIKGCTINCGDIDGGGGDVRQVLVCVAADGEGACITAELVAKGVGIGCGHRWLYRQR